jgi:hypothetical protein
MRGIINMKVDGVHEKFIYHPKNLTCCYKVKSTDSWAQEGKMCGGSGGALEKSPSIMKQKVTECYDTR